MPICKCSDTGTRMLSYGNGFICPECGVVCMPKIEVPLRCLHEEKTFILNALKEIVDSTDVLENTLLNKVDGGGSCADWAALTNIVKRALEISKLLSNMP